MNGPVLQLAFSDELVSVSLSLSVVEDSRGNVIPIVYKCYAAFWSVTFLILTIYFWREQEENKNLRGESNSMSRVEWIWYHDGFVVLLQYDICYNKDLFPLLASNED